jgi:hypothetical protein
MLNLKEENKAIQEKIKAMDFNEMQEHLFASVDKENHKVYLDFINDYMNKSQILVDILNENQINSVGKILQENNVDYEVENGHIRVGSTVLDEQDLDSLIYSRVMDMKEDYDLLYANDNSYLQKFSKEENLIDKRIEILEKGFEKIKIETELDDDKSNYKKSVKFQKEFEEKYDIKISENTFWYFEKKQDEKEVKEIQGDKKEIIKEKDDKEMEI